MKQSAEENVFKVLRLAKTQLTSNERTTATNLRYEIKT